MVNMKRALVALACAAVLAGCAGTRTEYVTTRLPLPPRPELPSIPGEQLQCLPASTYDAIATKDRLRREYAEQLEAIIRSTHDGGGDD